MRERRAGLSTDVAAAAAYEACRLLVETDEFKRANRVAGYVAVRGELDPAPALDAALRSGKRVYLPKVDKGGTLHFLPWRSTTPLAPNRFGIPEPDLPADTAAHLSHLDLVIVPLLAFDRCGTRLGTGAGFYDRSFEFKRMDPDAAPVLTGFAFAFQESEGLARAPWDVALDITVTEKEVIRIQSASS